MNFNVRDAYSIYKLYKELGNAIEFGIERERSLLNKYDGRFMSNGYIEFVHGKDADAKQKGIENMNKYMEEMEELNSMELPDEFSPLTLSYDSFGDQKITPDDIAALEGFVSFE